MKLSDIVQKSILSEKAYKQMEVGIYTFMVNPQATKKQVAQAVKQQFAVDVKKVNVAPKAAKSKRIAKTRKFTSVGGGKKAIVYLAAGQNIAMLSPKTKKEIKSKKAEGRKRSRREKDVQKTSTEGKEG